MDFKVIMVPYSGNDKEDGALRTAFSLAKEHDAHVEVWHVTPSPGNIMTVYYPGQGLEPIYSQELLMQLKNSYEESRSKATDRFFRIALEMGIETVKDGEIPRPVSASFHHATGDADEIISLHGRLCDLVVISRASEESGFLNDITYSALFDSARPVLLVPAAKSMAPSPAKIIIAWNNSLEASRSLGFSLPLLQQAKVWIWSGGPENQDDHSPGNSDLLRYLELHGITAEELLPNATTPESLLMTSKTLGASMIVMGAYSHSRFRETILGGMTNFMLKNATVPVFMAH